MLKHHYNRYCIRYGRRKMCALLTLSLLAVVLGVGYAGEYFYNSVHDVRKKVNTAERKLAEARQLRAEIDDLLNGKRNLVEPVSDKYVNVGRVQINWQLHEVVAQAN